MGIEPFGSNDLENDAQPVIPARAQQPEPTGNKKKRIGLLIAIGVVLAALVGVLVTMGLRGNNSSDTPKPAPSQKVATSGQTPGSEPSQDTQIAGCSPQAPIVPTKLEMPDHGWELPVISLGLDENGAAAAPPGNEPNMASWYNLGKKPGDSEGNAVFAVHTYRMGGAMGNKMLDPDTGFKEGDLIRVTGEDGKVLCYKYTSQLKVDPDTYEYQESGDVLYATTGKHQLAIIVCSDYDWSQRRHTKRVIFYAEPVTA